MFYGDVFAFVGDVIDEAHKSIEGDDPVAARFREEEEGVIEIAVGGFGDLETGLVGSGDGVEEVEEARGGRGFRRGGRFCGLGWRDEAFCFGGFDFGFALQFGCGMGYEQAAQQPGLFGFADRGAMLKRVVAARFDGVENGEAAAAEHFEIDAEASVDHFCERKTFVEKAARAGDEFLH